MNIKTTLLIFVFVALTTSISNAQVWYPEGIYNENQTQILESDNQQIISVSPALNDTSKSKYVVSLYNGKIWYKLPMLTLSRNAEVTDIKIYLGMVYVSGYFTFDNGTYNALVRYRNGNWEGLGNFKKLNLSNAGIEDLEVYKNSLILVGNFNLINSDTNRFISKHNGVSFSDYFKNCPSCHPNNTVTRAKATDTSIAFAGTFTKINTESSKYLYVYNEFNRHETFLNTPGNIQHLAYNGNSLYIHSDRQIYLESKDIFKPIKSNIDSIYKINSFLIYDGSLTISGIYKINSNTNFSRILKYKPSTVNWDDYTLNFPNSELITTTRNLLYASGFTNNKFSVWLRSKYSIARLNRNASIILIKVFNDANNNCIKESSEKPISKQFIKISNINRILFTNEDGYAETLVPNSVAIKYETKPPKNYTRSSCADTSLTKTITSGKYIDSIQFPLILKPNINDIRISIFSPKGDYLQKGKRVNYIVICENVGSNTVSGSVRLRKRKWLSSVFANPVGNSVNDSIYNWNYSNLKPGERQTFTYSGIASYSSLNNDTSQIITQANAIISNGVNAFVLDDSDSLTQQSTSNAKAFNKFITPTPKLGDSISYINNNDQIRYDIVFNNYTNDTVYSAVVTDSIDLNLDISEIQETGSNKNYTTEILTDPNNLYVGIIVWRFNQINLMPNPSKNYENLTSGAYIGFKILTKNITSGELIKNTATIYYDNNFAGKSNDTYCSTLPSSDIEQTLIENLKLYPNPYNSHLTIENKNYYINKVEIYNVTGQLIYTSSTELNTNHVEIKLENVVNGLQFAKITLSNGSVITKKLIAY